MDEQVYDLIWFDWLPVMGFHIVLDLVGNLVFAWIGLGELCIELAVLVMELLAGKPNKVWRLPEWLRRA